YKGLAPCPGGQPASLPRGLGGTPPPRRTARRRAAKPRRKGPRHLLHYLKLLFLLRRPARGRRWFGLGRFGRTLLEQFQHFPGGLALCVVADGGFQNTTGSG